MARFKVILVAGGRPNFMKIAPVWHEMNRYRKIKKYLLHTGQHYDLELSGFFLQDLNLPQPDFNLDVGSASHGEQTALILQKIEKIFMKIKPNLVYVCGDMNSTLAGALAAAKLHIPTAHIQAGWRSHDRRMPEEINRTLTDHLCTILFPETYEDAINLANEGIPKKRVFMVGNVMIDSLKKYLKIALKKSNIMQKLKLEKGKFIIVTAHRPENVDKKRSLSKIVKALVSVSKLMKIVYPVHPRTMKMLKKFNLLGKLKKGEITLTKPLGYLDFIVLLYHSRFALTDSGAVQEESIALNKPVITLRQNTELVKSVRSGFNILTGIEPRKVYEAARKLIEDEKHYRYIRRLKNPYQYWDGKAGKRIVKISLRLWKERKLGIPVSDFIEDGVYSFKLVPYGKQGKNIVIEAFDREGNQIPIPQARKAYKLKILEYRK